MSALSAKSLPAVGNRFEEWWLAEQPALANLLKLVERSVPTAARMVEPGRLLVGQSHVGLKPGKLPLLMRFAETGFMINGHFPPA